MESPAMTPDEIAEHPAATVRVYCRAHQVCLYAGDSVPDGGAEAVWQAAGCPSADATDEQVEACPVRPR